MCKSNCKDCENCKYKEYYDKVKKKTSSQQTEIRKEYLKKGICFRCKTNPVKVLENGKKCTLCQECMTKQNEASARYYQKGKKK